MSELLRHMPQALRDRIARSEISEAQIEANTKRLCEMLDHISPEAADHQAIRQLLQEPIAINPNASFAPRLRANNMRGVPQGSVLGLMLEYGDKAPYVEPLLKLGFDRSLFPENRYFLMAANFMPVETLWVLQQHDFDVHEQNAIGNNAFFAAIDANAADKIHALTQMGVDGDQKGWVPTGRGKMMVEPFQYAHDQRRGSCHVMVLEALLENGWGGIAYNENKSVVTTSKSEMISSHYNQALIPFFKHYWQRAQQIIIKDPAIYDKLSIKDLGAFASIGCLDHVMRLELWRGHEAQITDLFVQAPAHIQDKMSSLFPLLTAQLARHHIKTPVAEWNHGIAPPAKDRAL